MQISEFTVDRDIYFYREDVDEENRNNTKHMKFVDIGPVFLFCRQSACIGLLTRLITISGQRHNSMSIVIQSI